MDQGNRRNVLAISLSQFGIAFSFNFVMVFIPFLIQDVSPYPSRETLIWVGLIMGAPSFVAALASTFWGSLTSRFSSKLLYMRGLLSHAILVLLMGFVSSLPILLALRIVQGVLGGISTLGLYIVTSSSPKERASRDIGFFQNSMTLGQLIGPPIGALAASTLGYRGAFISASTVVFLTLAFCFFNVAEVSHELGHGTAHGKHTVNRRTLIAWGACFTVTVQLMFLPSVLPNVFKAFKIEETIALKWAGQVVMCYTATAVLGTYLLCRLAGKIRTERLIIAGGTLGVVLQALLCLCPEIFSFVAVRMLQTGMIAAVVPLVFSSFASDLDGRVIGFLNSSRFAGNALGPVIATSVLAFSRLSWLYLSVTGLSLMALLGFTFYSRGPEGTVCENGN